MNTQEHDWIGAHRAHETRTITTAFAVLAVVCLLAGLLPGVEHAITTVLIVAAVLAVLGVAARLAARWVRERREEHQDAITAAHWRAAHMPHLLTDTDRAHLRDTAGRVRAGVS